MAIWSTQAANVIIARALRDERALTHMQIQKLVYIAHGWSLQISDKRLTLDDPEAWRHGPVYRLLWDRLRYAERFPVSRLIPNSQLLPNANSQDDTAKDSEIARLEKTYDDYSYLSGVQLSLLTHDDNTPWKHVYQNGRGKNEPIPHTLIKDHFDRLVEKYV